MDSGVITDKGENKRNCINLTCFRKPFKNCSTTYHPTTLPSSRPQIPWILWITIKYCKTHLWDPVEQQHAASSTILEFTYKIPTRFWVLRETDWIHVRTSQLFLNCRLIITDIFRVITHQLVKLTMGVDVSLDIDFQPHFVQVSYGAVGTPPGLLTLLGWNCFPGEDPCL